MKDCIFCNMRDKAVVTKFLYEDADIMVFPDIHPVKPVHVLIVPKQHIADFSEITDGSLMDKVRIVLQKLIQEQQVDDKGYKIVVNGGGGQVVQHLHFHLIGPTGKVAPL